MDHFLPKEANKYPNITMVEEFLGGVGRTRHIDNTYQFEDHDLGYVYSPRLSKKELELFCEKHLDKYEEYYNLNEDLILKSEKLPPIFNFWETKINIEN